MTGVSDAQPDSTRIFSMRALHTASDEVRIASRVLGRRTEFPTPVEVAESAGIRLRATDLPSFCPPEMTDGRRTVFYRWHEDQRELGTRLFRGIASILLERHRGTHTSADISFLAARLAAPPLLVQRLGIDVAVDRQRWVTERFLRAWWAAM